ncbi:MAG: glycine--tRNA ligase subunit beta [Candidatus Omnitrophica bacterium]|nr:glycine--tRNA ligase subunit beta [Candidatus Omnitrophota bacterium]
MKKKSIPASSLQPPASRSADLLFEIGTEELPAAYLPGLIEQLDREAKTLCEANHLAFHSAATYGTPRRLVLHVRGLSAVQQQPGEEVRGPSKQASYDASGKPTPALLGFLKSQGGDIRHTKVVSTPKGDYVYLMKPPTTTPTVKLLPALLPQLITKLRAPKSMRWEASGVRFARPIRWLLARYGAQAVSCRFGLIAGQSKTRVGRPQQLRWATVSSIESYFKLLKRVGVILDPSQRRAVIDSLVAKTAKAFRGTTAAEMISHGLLEEVTFLTEEPVPLVGEFDKRYLVLPREVLLASMAKHQRVFAIEANGKLLPRCVAILDGKPGKPSEVRTVVERILNARLADSLLFWEQDTKQQLNVLAVKAAGITFHEKLGSVQDKVNRLCQMSRNLSKMWNLTNQESKELERASQLAKADLGSVMVREFPTLQGVMGKYYARIHRESDAVCQAIEEHYLPLAGKMPKTLIGSALASLDKFDTFASYFSIGIEPTGDQDPFGLRRAAQGIIEVAWAAHRPLLFENLFNAWSAAAGKPPDAKVQQRVRSYLAERLYTFNWPSPAPSSDCIDAVLACPWEDMIDAMDRIRTLQRMSGQAGLLKAAKVIERTRNILKGAKRADGQVQPQLLKEPPEQALWRLYDQHKERVAKLITDRLYDKATLEFGELFYEPLHTFFDKVLVNVPDEALQRNRLALMRAIHALYTDRVADLSKLTVLQQEPS